VTYELPEISLYRNGIRNMQLAPFVRIAARPVSDADQARRSGPGRRRAMLLGMDRRDMLKEAEN
jgi:hypothetical protein